MLVFEVGKHLVETVKCDFLGCAAGSIGGNLAPLLHAVDLCNGQRAFFGSVSLQVV